MRCAKILLIGTAVLAMGVIVRAHAAAIFTPCNDNDTLPELHGSLCATFEVPLRAHGPRTGSFPNTVHLFVREFPASGTATGTLWLVYGGPGGSGALFYPFLPTLRAAFPHFNLLIPDPRGTGLSTQMCPKQQSLDSPDGLALVGAEWNACWAALNAAPDYARAFSLTNAAYDLVDVMGQYDSSLPTWVYGVSYGTQVVSRMLVLPHSRLQGVILDSLVPPDSTTTMDLSHRSQIVNAVGLHVLQQCDDNPACRGMFKTSAVAAYNALLTAPPPKALH